MKRKKIFKKLKKILASNWVITVTASLVGVFMALYLNQRVANKRVNEQKQVALKNIRLEIEQNKEKINKSYIYFQSILEVLEFRICQLNDSNQLIAKPDFFNSITTKYPGLLNVKDSTAMGDNYYEYTTSVNFEIEETSAIAWETFKNTNLTASYDFECLLNLNNLYSLLATCSKEENNFLETLLENIDVKEGRDQLLIKRLGRLLIFEKALYDAFNENNEFFSECL